MNNQETIAWVMAAEGCFNIAKARNSLAIKISVDNTKEEFIDKFLSMVGYGHKGMHCRNTRNPNWNTIYNWYICSIEDCLKFCLAIDDYMPIKKEQVDLMIEFCARAISRDRHILGSQRQKSALEPRDWEIYEEMKLLNKRGKL